MTLTGDMTLAGDGLAPGAVLSESGRCLSDRQA
jgi:hypothetical protein